MTDRNITGVHDLAAAHRFLRNFPAKERKLGKQLHASGAVRHLESEDGDQSFNAEVQAKEPFAVMLFYNGEGWDAACNCEVEFDCEHAYAAMAALLASQKPDAKPKLIKAAGSPLEQKLLEKGRRKLDPDEQRLLKTIQDLYVSCQAKGSIDSWELGRLGFLVFGYGWGRLDLWPSFPKDDYEFWLYIAHSLLERKVQIPGFLAAITDFETIQEPLAAMKRKKDIARWQEQLRMVSGNRPPARRSSPVDFQLVLAPEAAHLEWKLAEGGAFKRLKQTELRRFAEQYHAGSLDIVPEASPLWHSFSQRFATYRWSYELRYDESETKRLLNPLLRLPGLDARILNQVGVALPRPAEPLRWKLRPAETEQEDYQLQLVRSDGSAAPPMCLTLGGDPALYVSQQAIYTGPPLLEGVLDTTQTNSIPALALETQVGAELVRRLGLDLPPRIEQRTQRINFKPKIFCELKATSGYSGGDSESIFIRVQADAEKGKLREIFTPSGWQPEPGRAGSTLKPKADVIYVYDRAAFQSFPSVLEALGPKWEDYRQRWSIRLTKNLPHRFVDWLQTIPKEIEVQLDEQLAALTKEPTQATVKLDCTEAGVDWFDLKVVLDVSDIELTPEELKALLDARGRFVRLGKKGWRRLQFNLSAEDDEQLARLGLSARDFSSEPQRLHALQLADKKAAPLLPERQAEQIQRRISELKTRVTPPVPETVRAQLRPYQIEGFHFLAYLTANHFGGILADDMGLGKTLQTLTWLAWLRTQPQQAKKPSLVVCPKSVMDTWRGEAERFTSQLRVKLWKGTDGSGLGAAAAETDLLVMNYSQLRGLGESITHVHWLTAILDEGQYIKNPESQTARVARSLKADYRLALSGTPIENRLMDLWSLMTFAMPGVLGNRAQFIKQFDQTGDALARRRLTARVRPFLLRRTKSQVATDLPDRIEEDLYSELEGQQKVLYLAEFKRAQQMLLNVQTRKELSEFRFHFLTSLLRLRQICCHPALYLPEAKGAESAKLNAFMELVEPLMSEGHKVLVFSQFVTMLDILRERVQEKNWPHFYLAGDTENRGQLVQDFQSAAGPALFLISLKAGGFGLNLTAASYVVLFDPWWNPAVEAQAIDRTHRIGQTSKVIAYRLLTKGSIEEKIRALQRTKSALMADVLGEDSFAGSLTLEDLQFLFSDDPLETPRGSALPLVAAGIAPASPT